MFFIYTYINIQLLHGVKSMPMILKKKNLSFCQFKQRQQNRPIRPKLSITYFKFDISVHTRPRFVVYLLAKNSALLCMFFYISRAFHNLLKHFNHFENILLIRAILIDLARDRTEPLHLPYFSFMDFLWAWGCDAHVFFLLSCLLASYLERITKQ